MSADPPAQDFAPRAESEGPLDAALLIGETDRLEVGIRRFSAAGATLSIAAALEPGESWILELRNGQCIDGVIAWSTGDEAGLAFDRAIDVVGILARNLAILPAERRRVPRVELSQTAGVRCGSEFEQARTRNISQAGMGIDTALHLAPDDDVQVALDGLPTLRGRVRWTQDGRAGIAFETELAWQVLMPWLRQAQRNPSGGGAGLVRRGLQEELRGFLAADKQAVRVDEAARVRQGASWWNVRVRGLSPHLVEFDAEGRFEKGSQLWIALPRMTGWPASVIESEGNHYLAEFRLPLRETDFALFVPRRQIAR